MWTNARGFMAIWSDVEPGDHRFYHDWLLKEHFPERIGVPGFLNARVFKRAVGDNEQFFILYETESHEVLASPAYIERLNNPTQMSRDVMPRLRNFVRGAGQVVSSNGLTSGGCVLTVRLTRPLAELVDPASREALLNQLRDLPGMLAVRLFEVEQAATGIQTAEKKMRTSVEASYSQLLVLEAPDETVFEPALERLKERLSRLDDAPFVASYRLIAELARRSLEPAATASRAMIA